MFRKHCLQTFFIWNWILHMYEMDFTHGPIQKSHCIVSLSSFRYCPPGPSMPRTHDHLTYYHHIAIITDPITIISSSSPALHPLQRLPGDVMLGQEMGRGWGDCQGGMAPTHTTTSQHIALFEIVSLLLQIKLLANQQLNEMKYFRINVSRKQSIHLSKTTFLLGSHQYKHQPTYCTFWNCFSIAKEKNWKWNISAVFA